MNDGGPAFPQTAIETEAHGIVSAGAFFSDAQGMSLRDWFAGQALAGKCGFSQDDLLAADDLANEAYAIADAMIAARERKEGE